MGKGSKKRPVSKDYGRNYDRIFNRGNNMVKTCSMSSAQRRYDNLMPDDGDTDDMSCPECFTVVELDCELKGTCDKCGTECEYDNDDF